MAGRFPKERIASISCTNLKGRNSIKKHFDAGMKKIMDRINGDAVLAKAIEYAKYAVGEAIENYRDGNEGVSLTGNTITGFGAGVFFDGELIQYISYKDASSIDGPHHPWTKPGESNFADYDTGEQIKPGTDDPAVKKYSDGNLSFNGTPYGGSTREHFSYVSTEQFIRNEFKPEEKGITIVVANVSPYVEYIHRLRGMDILDTNAINLKNDFNRILR